MAQTDKLTVYINSGQDDADGAGIHIFDLDLNSGALTPKSKVTAIPDCSYFEFDPSKRYLIASAQGKDPAVHSFTVDAETGDLNWISSQPAEMDTPCYVSTDSSGQFVLATTYSSPQDQGSVYVYPLSDDGHLGPRSDFRQYAGSSVNLGRQRSSHPHMIVQEPMGQLIAIPDLGTDRIMLHRLDTDTGRLEDHTYVNIEAGAGPRHVAFKPPFMYVITELGNTVTAFVYDEAAKTYTSLQTVSTMPDDMAASTIAHFIDPDTGTIRPPTSEEERRRLNQSADIHVHPSGNFLYGSNRGHNSLVAYRIGADGTLTLIGHTSTLGDWPRAFHIEESGRLLICANRRSNDVFTFWIDSDSGALSPTGHSVSLSHPICVRSLPFA